MVTRYGQEIGAEDFKLDACCLMTHVQGCDERNPISSTKLSCPSVMLEVCTSMTSICAFQNSCICFSYGDPALHLAEYYTVLKSRTTCHLYWTMFLHHYLRAQGRTDYREGNNSSFLALKIIMHLIRLLAPSAAIR